MEFDRLSYISSTRICSIIQESFCAHNKIVPVPHLNFQSLQNMLVEKIIYDAE